MFPSSNRWVANWIPTAERGLANGLIFAGVGAGSAFAPPLIRYAMVHLGWRASFWGCGVLGLLAAAGWYWMARDHPDQHSWLNDAERKWIHQGIPQRDPLRRPNFRGPPCSASKDVWALPSAIFALDTPPAIFFTWFFIYLTRVRGLNLQTASYYTMLPFLAMSLGSAVGRLDCRHRLPAIRPLVGTLRRGGHRHGGRRHLYGRRLAESRRPPPPASSWRWARVRSTSRKAPTGRSPRTLARARPARFPAS